MRPLQNSRCLVAIHLRLLSDLGALSASPAIVSGISDIGRAWDMTGERRQYTRVAATFRMRHPRPSDYRRCRLLGWVVSGGESTWSPCGFHMNSLTTRSGVAILRQQMESGNICPNVTTGLQKHLNAKIKVVRDDAMRVTTGFNPQKWSFPEPPQAFRIAPELLHL